MNPTPELVSAIQQDRERHIASDRLARIAACARACCSRSTMERLARSLRPSPASC
jgi:hypothetical protein